jgi:Mg-chelatase subunit ChlD
MGGTPARVGLVLVHAAGIRDARWPESVDGMRELYEQATARKGHRHARSVRHRDERRGENSQGDTSAGAAGGVLVQATISTARRAERAVAAIQETRRDDVCTEGPQTGTGSWLHVMPLSVRR